MMIGQRIGLPYLLALALDRLEIDPFAEGDYYPGDLLLAVLQVGSDFWSSNSELFWRLRDVMSGVESHAERLTQDLLPAWDAIK
jgi:hypothetical protein